MNQLAASFWHAIDYNLIPTAAFTVERMLAIDPSPENVHLHALVLDRQGRHKAVLMATKTHLSHIGCLYLYAESCLKLQKHADGARVLEAGKKTWLNGTYTAHSATQRSVIPDPSAFLVLLGKLYQGAGNITVAAEAYAMALSQNPFIWEAFERLTEMGINVNVANIFKPGYQYPVEDPFQGGKLGFGGSNTHAGSINNSVNTNPSASSSQLQQPSNLTTTFQGGSLGKGKFLGGKSSLYDTPTSRPKRVGFAGSTLGAGLNIANNLPSGQTAGGASTAANSSNAPSSSASSATHSSATIPLYTKIARGVLAFSRYELQTALKHFLDLPSIHRDSAYVLAKVGRIYFEQVNYAEAERTFARLRELDRTRVADMEVYSTTLWHLQKDLELAYLSRDLLDSDRSSPQAWCVLGNSFSVQREPELALKCFKRATALDPQFAYAYTLSGHEHVTSEALEQAQDAFRMALRCDSRHYNAWYGLGMVSMKLGDFERAEFHFKSALAINSNNVVLVCCVGMILERQNMLQQALAMYTRATTLQPQSALSRYKKARILMQLQRFNEALVEFDLLQTLAPDEASVHFLLGQLYKAVNKKPLAVKHYTIALNLDPKGSHLVREAIENLSMDGSVDT